MSLQKVNRNEGSNNPARVVIIIFLAVLSSFHLQETFLQKSFFFFFSQKIQIAKSIDYQKWNHICIFREITGLQKDVLVKANNFFLFKIIFFLPK